MKDPTRIPAVLEELRTTWEGQPDLSLATLFAIMQNSGVGWGTEDSELIVALRELSHHNPARIGPRITNRYVVNTIGPDNQITLDPYRIVVRRLRPKGEHTQPGVWDYTTVDRCEVGSPLMVTDQEGIRHRLGVVSSISLVSEQPPRYEDDLSGLDRSLIGDRVALFQLEGDVTVILNRTLNSFTTTRRSMEHTASKWDRLVQARPGQALRVSTPDSNEVMDFGTVQHCFYIDG